MKNTLTVQASNFIKPIALFNALIKNSYNQVFKELMKRNTDRIEARS